MTQERNVCALHEGMKDNVDCLWEKIGKLNDKLFWIMLLLALNLFLSGMNVAREFMMIFVRGIPK